MKSIHNAEQQEMLSINEMLGVYRLKYANRPKWLFGLHMAFLMSWLTIRHGDFKTLITFCLVLIYKAYIHYKAVFISLMVFIVYWIDTDLKLATIMAFVAMIAYLVYISFRQFTKDIGV